MCPPKTLKKKELENRIRDSLYLNEAPDFLKLLFGSRRDGSLNTFNLIIFIALEPY